MKRFLILLFILFNFSFSVNAQNYKGIWHGYITEYDFSITSGYVLQVKEHKGNIITGRAYVYSKKYFIFQGMLDFIGTIDKSGNKLTELVIVKSEMPTNLAYLCIKFLNLTYTKAGIKETLTGKWNGSSEVGKCAPGEVYLQRYTFDNPIQSDPIPEPIARMILQDNSPKMTFLSTELTPPIIINVKSTILNLEVRDYLREDNDTISVYFNRNPIISNLLIKKQSFSKRILLDKLSGLNEVIIYAENLGQVPPNTCVLLVDDGLKIQKVNIFSSKQSSEQSSAVIYLNYIPNNKFSPAYFNDTRDFNTDVRDAAMGQRKSNDRVNRP